MSFREPLLQDVRYAMRGMARGKLFTAMAVLSLALGIGANTAIYSFMDAVMLRSLPVKHPEQLVILNWQAKAEPAVVHSHWGWTNNARGGGITSPNYPYGAFELLRDHNDVLSTLFGHMEAGRLNLVINGQAELADAQYITGGYFAGLGVPPAAGRLIGPDDDRIGAPPVVVIAYDFFQSRFHGNAAAVGQPVQINGASFTIAGVAAPEFYGVSPEFKPSLFLPAGNIGLTDARPGWPSKFHESDFYWIELMGRLKPGVTLAQAQAQLAATFHAFVESSAATERDRADLPSLWLEQGGSGVDSLRRIYSKPLWILMTMVGLILIVACFNIANLLLARATGRRREIALRLSLGAPRSRVIRQLLTESLVLSTLSGIAGIGIAALGIRLLSLLLAIGSDPFAVPVRLDWRVLGFTLIIAFASGILFGLAPALQSARVDVTPALKETRGGQVQGRSRRFGLPFGLSQALVSAQIAISLLLVVAAGLFVRTLANLHSVNLGFNAENLLTFHLNAVKVGYKDASLKRFYEDLQERFQTIPGVGAVTSSDLPLVGGWSGNETVQLPGVPPPPEGQRRPSTSIAKVGTTFFETMEIPIVAGRALNQRDVEGAPLAAVINQVFAEKYFPGQNPVGRHFKIGGNKEAYDVEIVGVARTARYNTLKREIPPVTYLSWRQTMNGRSIGEIFFEMRAAGDPLALANSAREIVRQADSRIPVEGIMTQSERIDQTIFQERAFAKLCACFGALALIMACVGLYGTMAYSVARRTGEIGIRMALGATRRRVVWMVLHDVIALSAAGLVVGLIAAYQSTAFLKSFLFGVQPNDPFAIGAAVVILIACALMAGCLPAFRASRIDPMAALRNE